MASTMLACVAPAHAEGFEDVINAIARPRVNQKVYFAVIDVRANAPVEVVVEAVQNSVKRYATRANLAYKLPPATLSAHAARMHPVSRGRLQGVEVSLDVVQAPAVSGRCGRAGCLGLSADSHGRGG